MFEVEEKPKSVMHLISVVVYNNITNKKNAKTNQECLVFLQGTHDNKLCLPHENSEVMSYRKSCVVVPRTALECCVTSECSRPGLGDSSGAPVMNHMHCPSQSFTHEPLVVARAFTEQFERGLSHGCTFQLVHLVCIQPNTSFVHCFPLWLACLFKGSTIFQ